MVYFITHPVITHYQVLCTQSQSRDKVDIYIAINADRQTPNLSILSDDVHQSPFIFLVSGFNSAVNKLYLGNQQNDTYLSYKLYKYS